MIATNCSNYLQLVRSSDCYKDSYADYLRELITVGNDPDVINRQIAAIVSTLERQRSGAAPQLDYWLLRGKRVIGALQLRLDPTSPTQVAYDIRPSCRRQGIGTRLLSLGLIEAHQQGLSPLCITCLETNVASRKIIERNGGILRDIVPHAEGQLLCFRILLELL